MEIIVILVSVVMLYLVIAYLRQLDKKLDILERMYVEEVQDLRKMVKILNNDYLKREEKCSYCLDADTPKSFREGPCSQCVKDYFE